MAINIPVYNNVNAVSKSIMVDFVGDVLAPSDKANVSSKDRTYFFKFTTNGADLDNRALPPKVTLGLDDLCLNGIRQSATNTTASYADVKSMIVDYCYDYIYGHTANQWGDTGVKEQKAMKL